MLTIYLITLAAIMNAIMDMTGVKYNQTIFSLVPGWDKFCNGAISWVNKWKNGDHLQGEKFFGSSTFMVWTTDLWHLAKAIMLLCFSLAITTYKPIFGLFIDTIGLWFYFGTVFTIFYDYLLRKKFWGFKVS